MCLGLCATFDHCRGALIFLILSSGKKMMLILFTFTPLNLWFIFIKEGIVQVNYYSYLQMSAFKQPGNSSLIWRASALAISPHSQPGYLSLLI